MHAGSPLVESAGAAGLAALLGTRRQHSPIIRLRRIRQQKRVRSPYGDEDRVDDPPPICMSRPPMKRALRALAGNWGPKGLTRPAGRDVLKVGASVRRRHRAKFKQQLANAQA